MSTEPRLQYRFDEFELDIENRQLWRDGQQINLNRRYFDALVLLVRKYGQLVEKEQFFSEVWGDIVVSDSALTQCIKDIRKKLGDDASNPHYIQTVPAYGYRFIGKVEINPSPANEQAESETTNTFQASSSKANNAYYTVLMDF